MADDLFNEEENQTVVDPNKTPVESDAPPDEEPPEPDAAGDDDAPPPEVEDKTPPEAPLDLEGSIQRVLDRALPTALGKVVPLLAHPPQGMDPVELSIRQEISTLENDIERIDAWQKENGDNARSSLDIQRRNRRILSLEERLEKMQAEKYAQQQKANDSATIQRFRQTAQTEAGRAVSAFPQLSKYRGVVEQIYMNGDQEKFMAGQFRNADEFVAAVASYGAERGLVTSPPPKKSPSIGLPARGGAKPTGAAVPAKDGRKFVHTAENRRFLKEGGWSDEEIAKAEKAGVDLLAD